MDRDRSSARHLSAELEDPLRPESSQIPEKMLPWCPKFRDLAGWLPQIAPSDLAPSDETQDHEETVLNVGQPWLHIMAQPSCVFQQRLQLNWHEIIVHSPSVNFTERNFWGEQLSPGESITLLCWGTGELPGFVMRIQTPLVWYFLISQETSR